ncbi:MAG TPA: class I SAM-dependent RNA methyltransferase [Thermotogota bacterium]|nr:class I SAM-dependent RNA methyltransferase [Thermotogota bacterium]HPJ87517.1 class I SAM-dependent RNA methyltransferase [Thermotogota bacterium]HPR94722.1 class I SAM-dependent RNA methyltransferase [Thermotogota bacterium]
MKFMATCTAGLESPLAYEIKELGLNVIDSSDGKAIFEGEERDLVRANLWLRTAERVFIILDEFTAFTSDELYDNLSRFDWKSVIPKDGNLLISRVKIKKSELKSTRITQSVAQKAILSKLCQSYSLNRMPMSGKEYPVHIYIRKNGVTVALETSGNGLHMRGYRTQAGRAPLRETIAAGLLKLARWNENIELVDPFCGSGTIIIEAAMIARNQAPGLYRSFLFEDWSLIDKKIISDERRNARKLIKKTEANLTGYDTSAKMIEYAEKNSVAARISEYCRFEQQPMEQLRRDTRYGFVLTNPPFGERLNDKDAAFNLYQQMKHLKKDLQDWSYFIYTSHEQTEKAFDMKASKKKWILNSGLKTWLYFFWGPKPKKGDEDNDFTGNDE